jgi:acid-activated urea channel
MGTFGVVLLFVGFTLVHNGIARLTNIDERSSAVMNAFMGVLLALVNIFALYKGEAMAAGQGFLFAFTYLYLAANKIWGLDYRPFGWFCLFVVINAIPFISMCFLDGDVRLALMWTMWAIFWFSGFWEIVLGKSLGKAGAYLAILTGIASAWIPGFFMIIDKW